MPSKRQSKPTEKMHKLSTGPKTPEGRAAVRLNGVTTDSRQYPPWSCPANTSRVPGPVRFPGSRAQPATPRGILVGQLAMATWRLRRLYQMEAGYLSIRLHEWQGPQPSGSNTTSTSQLLGLLVTKTSTLWLLSPLPGPPGRSFYKALQELQRLRSLRQQM